MRRFLARLGALLVCVTGLGAFGAAPAAAAPGFELNVTELPGTFRAGADAERVSAVVSTSNDDGCRKVLWSLLLRVEGLRLDQVSVDRVEQDGSFPVRVSTDGNTARITDTQLDPGTLCRDRTVTAQYRVAIDGDVTDGRITFTPEAYDPDQRLLAQTSASREIVSDRSRREPADRAERKPPTTAPAPTPTPARTEPATDEPVEEPVDPDASGSGQPGADLGGQPGTGAGQADATAGTSGGGTGLVTIGFVVGGLMLFLGVGLLLRLRRRMLGDDDLAVAPGYARSHARTVPRAGARYAGPAQGAGPFRYAGPFRGAAPGRRRRHSTIRY